MAVCIFENEKEEKYECTYNCKDGKIYVKVNKELYSDEYKTLGILRVFQEDEEEYKEKTINIFDSDNKKYLKLFNCYISSYNTRYGSIDGYESVTYSTNCYIKGKREEDIYNIDNNPKASMIRIYHPTIEYLYGHPSTEINKNENFMSVILKKNIKGKNINIDCNNIKNILISDDWDYLKHNNQIDISLTGYAELELKNEIELSEVIYYIKEFQIYMELLKQKSNNLKKISIRIENKYFELEYDDFYKSKENKNAKISCNGNIEEYLTKCYRNMPIRGNDSSNRNIPYVLFEHSRNLEDTFLLCYRFIECFYKKKNFKSNFILKAFTDSKNIYLKYFKEEELDEKVLELICLRNKYVHSGYHIKDSKLNIRSKDRKINYNVKIDFDWIYKRTNLLYDIVIDIIYKQILEISDYSYNNHF